MLKKVEWTQGMKRVVVTFRLARIRQKSMQAEEKEPPPQNLEKVIALLGESLGVVMTELLKNHVISSNSNDK